METLPTTPLAAKAQSKKRPAKYLPNVSKRKKDANLIPGVAGFFITCDGGRERQATREAINLLDEFHEKLLKAKQSPSDKVKDAKFHPNISTSSQTCPDESGSGHSTPSDPVHRNSKESDAEADDGQIDKAGVANSVSSIADLLEAEIKELKDIKKVVFAGLDTGCNGVIFIRMLTEIYEDASEGPSPNELVEAIMHKAVTFKKPLTRFCLKLLPVEITCYASADEMRKAAEPVILRHFPQGGTAHKFAVVYEARANSSANRMEFINAIAKLVPEPHSVDLKKPDKTIIVQIVKTICTIGVIQNFKELSKYNLRQLTSQKQQP